MKNMLRHGEFGSGSVYSNEASKNSGSAKWKGNGEHGYKYLLPTGKQRAEIDHGVGEGRGVEDLPRVDLVGPELVGVLHPRRR